MAAAFIAMIPTTAFSMGCGGRVQTGYGDNALALAQRCGTTVQQLRLSNPSVDMNRPLNGQIIQVPSSRPPGYIPDSVKRGAPPASSVLSPVPHSHRPIVMPGQTRSSSEAAAEAANGSTSYRVRRGDTLHAIAAGAHVSLARLLAANPEVDPRRLQVGQTIVVPSGD